MAKGSQLHTALFPKLPFWVRSYKKNDVLGTGDTLSEIFQQEEGVYVDVHRLHNACCPLNISGVHKMNRAGSNDT